MNSRKLHNTTTDNLMTLLKVGAFGLSDSDSLAKMSPYKWRKLTIAAEQLGVLHYIAKGAGLMQGTEGYSKSIGDSLESKSQIIEEQKHNKYEYSDAKLFNSISSRKRDGVINEETSRGDMSEETLNLLDIIIANMDDIITKDITLKGIVTMGEYIRSNKGKIDYDKLIRWLMHIGLVQVASLEGSMLISCFGFTEEELPFVAKQHKKAKKLLFNPVVKVFGKHSFSNATRMNVAMLETFSNILMKGLIDIEE